MGTGPVYCVYCVFGSVKWASGTYVLPVKSGRMSRPAMPPGGLAQCRVGSTGSRWGRKLPAASLRSLIHLTRTGVFHLASMVSDGALCSNSPLLLSDDMYFQP